jgi:hypothetical protein
MNFNSKATPLAWPQLSKIILAMKLTAYYYNCGPYQCKRQKL